MAIKLRVISDQYRELGERRSRVFGVNGGSIGRAPDNDWVLPDQKRLVSGHHCDIVCRTGEYWISDHSTNGVFVNDSDDTVAETGPVALKDGDRLRMGDYEILVSVDDRFDFLPVASEMHSAEKHIDSGINAGFDVESLFAPRDTGDSSSISIRNAFGLKLPKDFRAAAAAALGEPAAGEDDSQHEPPPAPPNAAPEPDQASAKPADWAMKTRAVTRQELADALARRQSRIEARQQTLPFHQQASSWADLGSAVQAFCRGAGIDPAALSPEAQSMLPLVAGQLLREAVVGVTDLQQARAAANPAIAAVSAPNAISNPLRNSTSVEQAITRLLESHGRSIGGPVDALRDVLLDAKEHEAAINSALHEGLSALLAQLAPSNVADQFEDGRSRTIAPGQDPRPKYWEHYGELFRVVTQNGADGLPHPFLEAFTRAYESARAEMSSRRGPRNEN
ncbi:MAG: type VI secretion system-associated FHA domain protein TagH [Steroidobacteraceae bacterium]|nr:type VI secretion system-associated FHA domain protein TagH [Steroidobacteraceae bacterium]